MSAKVYRVNGRPVVEVVHSSSVEWHRADDELPEDDQLVIVALHGGETNVAFVDCGDWRLADASKLREPVLWWAQLPPPPMGN